MFRLKRIQLNKIREFLKKLPRILAEQAFISFLVLLLLALILGGLIFYKYSILVQKEKLEVPEGPIQFKEKTYQEVLKIWQEREKKFEEANSKQYLNPFDQRMELE
jgi:predicted neutral ceramidase superfamily lipid hydrolase